MTLYEVDEAASRVRQEVDPEANIIVGATFDDQLGDAIRVAIVASGMNGQALQAAESAARSSSQRVEAREEAQPRSPQPPAPPLPTPAATQRAASQPAPRGPAESVVPPQLPPLTPAAKSPVVPTSSQPSPRDEQPQADEPPRTLWHAPGNVVIEEARPTQMHQQPARQPRPAAAAPASAAIPADPFAPAPPEEVRRIGGARRVPDLEDFPAIGQRDYHAKAGQYDPGNANPGHPPRLPGGSPPAPRGSLLQRMIGGTRKSSSSVDDDEPDGRNDPTTRLPSFFNRGKG
ncbi:MAG: hypothetical protein AB7F78_26290, partial [Hyphomicrobiaceae bacterium]